MLFLEKCIVQYIPFEKKLITTSNLINHKISLEIKDTVTSFPLRFVCRMQ